MPRRAAAGVDREVLDPAAEPVADREQVEVGGAECRRSRRRRSTAISTFGRVGVDRVDQRDPRPVRVPARRLRARRREQPLVAARGRRRPPRPAPAGSRRRQPSAAILPQARRRSGPGARASRRRRSRGRSRRDGGRRGRRPRSRSVGLRRADHHVAELAGPGARAGAVDREREDVGRPVAVAVLAVELADPLLADELDREVPVARRRRRRAPPRPPARRSGGTSARSTLNRRLPRGSRRCACGRRTRRRRRRSAGRAGGGRRRSRRSGRS